MSSSSQSSIEINSTSSNSTDSSSSSNSVSSLSSILIHSTSSNSSSSTLSSNSSLSSIEINSTSSRSSFSTNSFSFLSKSSKSSVSTLSESSSSFHYSYSKLLPFTFEENITKAVSCLAYDGTYIYACIRNKILRSLDGMIWDLYFQIEDVYVNSLYAYNNVLYIGSSPNGYIYTADLIKNKISFIQKLKYEIVSFISYNNIIYVFTSNKSGVYKYNTNISKWELIYSPYANIIYDVAISPIKSKTINIENEESSSSSEQITESEIKEVIAEELLIIINSNNIIRFNGRKFYLQAISTDILSNVSSETSNSI
jgi:hypothetical protein